MELASWVAATTATTMINRVIVVRTSSGGKKLKLRLSLNTDARLQTDPAPCQGVGRSSGGKFGRIPGDPEATCRMARRVPDRSVAAVRAGPCPTEGMA